MGGAQHNTMAISVAGLARRNLQSPSTTDQNYRMNGKIIISALAILLFIVFIILLLHMYAKWVRRSSNIRSRPGHSHSLSLPDTSLTGGLEKATVEALPIFRYRSPCLFKAKGMAEAVKCVVCLSNFQQDENCKLLPTCKHFFHRDCIDMWLLSNTTCPLCRTTAQSSDCDKELDAAASMSCCFTNQDGDTELGEQYQRATLPTLCTRASIAYDNSNSDGGERQEDSLLIGHFPLQLPTTSRSYRRSKSEKFSHGTPSPTSIIFSGNQSHTTTRTNPTRWQTGGRSFSHITIDILRPQESLVGVASCPTLPSSPKQCSNLPHRPVNELKSLKKAFQH